jgi:hypothetical protein
VYFGAAELLGMDPCESQEERAYGLVLPSTDVEEFVGGIGRRGGAVDCPTLV